MQLNIIAALENVSDPAQIQSKPMGYWIPEKKIYLWQLDKEFANNNDTEQKKLIARFPTTGEMQPKPLALKFKIENVALADCNFSATSLSTSLAGTFSFESNVVSGKYLIEPNLDYANR